MSTLEITAVLFYLVSVALTIRKNIWFWPAGIVAVSCYFVIFLRERLYADMGLQVIYLLQSCYGWYYWLVKKREENNSVKIKACTVQERIATALAILAMTVATSFMLQRFTDASLPVWDSLAMSLSLAANFLLARRLIENWILWILADVLYIAIFYQKGLYLSALIYLIFLFMSVTGLMQWKKELSLKKASS